MPDQTTPRYYTVAEAAAIMRCKPKTVWTLCKNGKIPGATKPAGTWLIPVDEFDAWVASGSKATA